MLGLRLNKFIRQPAIRRNVIRFVSISFFGLDSSVRLFGGVIVAIDGLISTLMYLSLLCLVIPDAAKFVAVELSRVMQLQ